MSKVAVLLVLTALLMPAESFPHKPLIEGDPSSAVRVVIYEDLQCPDCAAFRTMLDTQLLPKFKGSVAFEHRDFPLPKHEWARQAAEAAHYYESISPQLGVEFRREVMAKQARIRPETFYKHLTEFAAGHKIDPSDVVLAMNDAALVAEVEAEYQEGIARGVERVPTVLVNGQPFVETIHVAEIVKAIERELKAAK